MAGASMAQDPAVTREPVSTAAQRPPRARYSPIGIEVRHGAVLAAQCRLEGGAWRPFLTASEPLVDASGASVPLLQALASIREHYPFAGNRAVAALSPADVEIRPLRLPKGVTPNPDGAFDALLRTEARSCLLYDPAEAVLDYLPLAEEMVDGAPRHTILLIAARREKVNRFLAMLRQAGFRCEHLEVAPCAAARAVNETGGYYLMADIGEDQTVMSIAEGQRLLFSRVIKWGFGAWVQSLKRALDLRAEEARELLLSQGFDVEPGAPIDYATVMDTGALDPAVIPAALYEICSGAVSHLLKETRRTLDYFALLPDGGRVSQLVLLGDGLPRHLDTLLASRLKLPVTVGAMPFGGSESPMETDARIAARWMVPLGLSLRGENA